MPRPPTPHRAPRSPEQAEALRKGLCFRCGKPGHKTAECPSPPKPREKSGFCVSGLVFGLEEEHEEKHEAEHKAEPEDESATDILATVLKEHVVARGMGLLGCGATDTIGGMRQSRSWRTVRATGSATTLSRWTRP